MTNDVQPQSPTNPDSSHCGRRKRRILTGMILVGGFIFLAHYVITIMDLERRVDNLNIIFRELAGRQIRAEIADSEQQELEDTSVIRVGDQLPSCEFTLTDGKIIHTDNLRGKVVLLNFFATWCGPCQQEMPRLQVDIWERFRSQGLVVLAVARGSDQTPDTVRDFAKKHGYTFTFATDPTGKIFHQFATSGIPRCYVVSPQGRVRLITQGYAKYKEEEFQMLVRMVNAELERMPSSRLLSRTAD